MMEDEVFEEMHVPVEIVKEILQHLPLKSLAQFMCVSKLWLITIKGIIHGRLREEMDRIIHKLEEIQGRVLGLSDEAKNKALLVGGDACEMLLMFRDLMAFREYIHRHHVPNDVEQVCC